MNALEWIKKEMDEEKWFQSVKHRPFKYRSRVVLAILIGIICLVCVGVTLFAAAAFTLEKPRLAFTLTGGCLFILWLDYTMGNS